METSFLFFILLTAIFSLGFYLIPTFLAFSRNHDSKIWVAILNIFLGWTLLGWFFALVWAAFGQKKSIQITNSGNPTSIKNSGFYQGISIVCAGLISMFSFFLLLQPFLQEVFQMHVPLKILFYQTASFPIYMWFILYFFSGLALGTILLGLVFRKQ